MSSAFGSKKTARRAPAQLSPDQAAEIKECFSLFDLDRDNRIDFHELKVAMRALGFDLKKAEVLKIMRDVSTDGYFTFDQFHRTSPFLLRGPE